MEFYDMFNDALDEDLNMHAEFIEDDMDAQLISILSQVERNLHRTAYQTMETVEYDSDVIVMESYDNEINNTFNIITISDDDDDDAADDDVNEANEEEVERMETSPEIPIINNLNNQEDDNDDNGVAEERSDIVIISDDESNIDVEDVVSNQIQILQNILLNIANN